MTALSKAVGPAQREALADALARWLPGRRWFAGKARSMQRLEVADLAVLDERLLQVITEVTYADGGRECYQTPLAVAEGRPDEAGVVARLGDLVLVDAAVDGEACRRLATLTLRPHRHDTASGAGLVGRPVAADGAGRLERPRALGAEQSNTSVVFGDRTILKLFRKLESGTNPDIELTRALTEAGFAHVPRQHGALELVDADGGTTALAVLTDFVAGGQEGWALALQEVGALRRADADEPALLLPRVADLGGAVAEAHLLLAERFGRRPATAADAREWAESMRAHADEVLRTAAQRAPDAAALTPRRDELLAAFARLTEVADLGPLTRVHGDLHLGQVLLDRAGRWQLLDFEGEPARPMAVRRQAHPPARDVAGMLRSFAYAAASGGRGTGASGGRAARGDRWEAAARERFLDGYRAVAGPAGLLPRAPADAASLLAAYELDKAVYELGYELANRPDWVPIPLRGILRVLDDAPRGRKTTMTDSSSGEPVASVSKAGADWRAPSDQVRALLDGVHRDPHSLLGVHPLDRGAVVRAYRPDALRVEVVVGGGDPVEAEQTTPAFFEARLDTVPAASEYRLRVHYADGAAYDLYDAYAFWPTFGDIDLHLAGEGRHEELWRRMGAHVTEVDGVSGTAFAVWAPNARSVRVVGDFNSWDGRLAPMRTLGASGVWELFVPDAGSGQYYKYELVTQSGALVTRADPYAFATDVPPGTASRIHRSQYAWSDDEWFAARKERHLLASPVSVYEVHLSSWRHRDGQPLGYRELAHQLGDHCERLGFTHVELLPVAEHPFGGSWGYQVTGYFAPTARHGDPDDFRYFVDHLHQRGIGVIVDWVPAHFPRDAWALARFDGTALYEHADPRQGEHPDWGTLVFNFGRNEVRNFLIANALFWLEELHVDGLRVDAVASMLYLDYSREAGQWVPNRFGGRENLEAVDFLKELNAVVYGRNPGAVTIAEESTAWPGVSRPVYLGGLGFGFKWNMGWMHDTLSYFAHDPIHRRFHHNQLTFGFMYAWSENYVLPLSHDEVVHGKRSLIDKMPGDRWQKFANLRALYGYMWAHPGKQLLFMGGEFGQWREWSEERELDWYLLGEDDHLGLQRLVGDLNARYRELPGLWQRDAEPAGFDWIDANDADNNVVSFVRYGHAGAPPVVCVCNFSPVPRRQRVGMPAEGRFEEVLNTDAGIYGGGNVGNLGAVHAEATPWHGKPASAMVNLPPLGTVWLAARA